MKRIVDLRFVCDRNGRWYVVRDGKRLFDALHGFDTMQSALRFEADAMDFVSVIRRPEPIDAMEVGL